MRLDELVPGKWYDCSTWPTKVIAKYESTDSSEDRIFISESLSGHGSYVDYKGKYDFYIVSKRNSVFFEVSQAELDRRLPQGHKDTYTSKSNKHYDWSVGDEFTVSVDHAIGSDLIKGVVYTVKSVWFQSCEAETQNERLNRACIPFEFMIPAKQSIKYVNQKDLIDGNWYKFSWKEKLYGSTKVYGKFCRDRSCKDTLITSEGIWDNEYRERDGYGFKDLSEIELVSVKDPEINKLLPSNHPDRIWKKIEKRPELNRTFLPENWCLRVNGTYISYPAVYEWRRNNKSQPSKWLAPGYICSNRRFEPNSDGLGEEISIEEFKRLVYEPFVVETNASIYPLTPDECFKKEEEKIKTEATTNIVIPRLKKTRSIVVESTKNVTI